MDKIKIALISNKVLEALLPLEKELGVKFADKGGTIGTSNFTMKLEAAEVKDGQVMTREAERFKLNAKFVGLEASDLYGDFVLKSGTYKLVGLSATGLFQGMQSGKVYNFNRNAEKGIVEAVKKARK